MTQRELETESKLPSKYRAAEERFAGNSSDFYSYLEKNRLTDFSLFVGYALAKLKREKRIITNEEFAILVGVAKSHISNMLSGDNIPKRPVIEQIAKAAGIPLWEALTAADILSDEVLKSIGASFDIEDLDPATVEIISRLREAPAEKRAQLIALIKTILDVAK